MAYSDQFIAKLAEEQSDAQHGLQDLVISAITAGQAQQDGIVRDYMLHGVARRLNLLRQCLITIFERFPPKTTKPLDTEILHEVQINLHAFVMNLYGTFENLAWAFVACHKLQGVIGNRTNVGLFLRSTQQFLPTPLRDYLTSPTIAKWHSEYLKNYRDALAHKIPLYIPPARYTDEEAARDRTLGAMEHEYIRARRWNDLERVRAEREELGNAFPIFLHSFSGGDRVRPVHLHPQLICDAKTILEFGPLFFAHWHEHVAPTRSANKPIRPKRSVQDFEDEATLFSLSGEYLEAARMLRDTPPVRVKVDIVIYYLAGHAAELLLKSFLYKKGDTIEDLRLKFGHDLGKLVERAKARGLSSMVSVDCMLSFSEVYADKKTEYRSGGHSLPILDDLIQEVQDLQAYVFNHVATYGDAQEEPDQGDEQIAGDHVSPDERS